MVLIPNQNFQHMAFEKLSSKPGDIGLGDDVPVSPEDDDEIPQENPRIKIPEEFPSKSNGDYQKNKKPEPNQLPESHYQLIPPKPKGFSFFSSTSKLPHGFSSSGAFNYSSSFENNLSLEKLLVHLSKYILIGTLIFAVLIPVTYCYENEVAQIFQMVALGLFYSAVKTGFVSKAIDKISRAGNKIGDNQEKERESKEEKKRIFEPVPFSLGTWLVHIARPSVVSLKGLESCITIASGNIYDSAFIHLKATVFTMTLLFCSGVSAVFGVLFILLWEKRHEFIFLFLLWTLFFLDFFFTIILIKFKQFQTKRWIQSAENSSLGSTKLYTDFLKEIFEMKRGIKQNKRKLPRISNKDSPNENNPEIGSLEPNGESASNKNAQEEPKEQMSPGIDRSKASKRTITTDPLFTVESSEIQRKAQSEEIKIAKYDVMSQVLKVLQVLNVGTVFRLYFLFGWWLFYLSILVAATSLFIVMQENTISLYFFLLIFLVHPLLLELMQVISRSLAHRQEINMSGQLSLMLPVAAQTIHMMLLVLSFQNALFALFFSFLSFGSSFLKFLYLRRKGNEINMETLRKMTSQPQINHVSEKKAQIQDLKRQKTFLNQSMRGRTSVFSGLANSELVKRSRKRKLALIANTYINMVLKWAMSTVFIPQYLLVILLVLKDKGTYRNGLIHPWLIWTNVVVLSLAELLFLIFSAKHVLSLPSFFQIRFFEKIQYKLFFSNKSLFLVSWFFCYFLALIIFSTVYSRKL